MAAAVPYPIDPKLDLVLDRVIDIPPEKVWAAWTQPEQVKVWFCPKPWSVSHCEIDLRPGGLFKTIMVSPEGQQFLNVGCLLEVKENERLVWTDALLPGYRPAEKPFFTGVLILQRQGTGTRYIAIGLHKDEASRQQHEQMGFQEGWGKALDQLVAHAKTL